MRAHGREGIDIQAVLGTEGRHVTVRSTAHKLLSQGAEIDIFRQNCKKSRPGENFH